MLVCSQNPSEVESLPKRLEAAQSVVHSDIMGVLFICLRFLYCVTGNYSHPSTDPYIHSHWSVLRPHWGNLNRGATGVVTTLLAVGPYLLKDREASLRDRIGGWLVNTNTPVLSGPSPLPELLCQMQTGILDLVCPLTRVSGECRHINKQTNKQFKSDRLQSQKIVCEENTDRLQSQKIVCEANSLRVSILSLRLVGRSMLILIRMMCRLRERLIRVDGRIMLMLRMITILFRLG